MEETLKVINQMQADGVIGKYAIGGAIAAIQYVEPFATQDLDIFVMLPSEGPFLILDPIYSYLTAKGYSTIGDAIQIGDWPVQFLPAHHPPLLVEAWEEANEITYASVPTRVFTPEHLIAIMVQTGRHKDIARVRMFFDQCNSIDDERLMEILQKHDLLDKWRSIIRQ